MVLLVEGFQPGGKLGRCFRGTCIRFEPIAFEDPMGAFTKLKQIGSVEEYQTTFEILSNKVNEVSEEFHINTFLSRLKDELRIIVTMFKPNTLVTAFGLTHLLEEVNRKHNPYKFSSAQNNSYPSTFRSSPKNHTFNPMAILLAPYPALKLPTP